MLAAETLDVAQALADITSRRPIRLAPGTIVDSASLKQLLAALEDDAGRRSVHGIDFSDATFEGPADFSACRFRGPAHFRRAVLRGPADFSNAHFEGDCDFSGASFAKPSTFAAGTFSRGAKFEAVLFSERISVARACFHGDLSLRDSRFGADVDATALEVLRGLDLTATTWSAARTVGPLLVGDCVDCNGARFQTRLTLLVLADHLDLSNCALDGGGDVRATVRTATLRASDFSGITTISGVNTAAMPQSSWVQVRLPQLAALNTLRRPHQPTAVLASLAGANVVGLTLDQLDLSRTDFAGALNLDKLRLGPSVLFAVTTGWHARRAVVSQEQNVRRALKAGSSGRALQGAAHDVALTYRALRKSLEDARNEPGAADFYFGEMEMRRLASRSSIRTRCSEGLALWLYWFSSGYGTRAWRALSLLLTIVLAGGILMSQGGFDRTPPSPTVVERILPNGRVEYRVPGEVRTDFAEGLRFSAEAATSLLRPTAPRRLTDQGRLLEIVLRLLGPALLALAIVSFRARLKR